MPNIKTEGSGLAAGRQWQSAEENGRAKGPQGLPNSEGSGEERKTAVKRLSLQSRGSGCGEAEGSGWEGKLVQREDILSIWPSAHECDMVAGMTRAFADRDTVSIFEGYYYFLLPLVFLRSLINLLGTLPPDQQQAPPDPAGGLPYKGRKG